MQKIRVGAAALFVFTALVTVALVNAFAVTAAAQETTGKQAAEKSLYERLGGEAAISAVVDDFAQRVLADERVNKKFARSDAPRLLFHLKEQVCAVTGGPCKYTGRPMTETHRNMKVTEGEFGALVEDLVATLNKFNVPEKEKGELLSLLGPLKSQIVEVNSAETGTALPAEFKPAPPLDESKIKKGPFPKGKGGKTVKKTM